MITRAERSEGLGRRAGPVRDDGATQERRAPPCTTVGWWTPAFGSGRQVRFGEVVRRRSAGLRPARLSDGGRPAFGSGRQVRFGRPCNAGAQGSALHDCRMVDARRFGSGRQVRFGEVVQRRSAGLRPARLSDGGRPAVRVGPSGSVRRGRATQERRAPPCTTVGWWTPGFGSGRQVRFGEAVQRRSAGLRPARLSDGGRPGFGSGRQVRFGEVVQRRSAGLRPARLSDRGRPGSGRAVRFGSESHQHRGRDGGRAEPCGPALHRRRGRDRGRAEPCGPALHDVADGSGQGGALRSFVSPSLRERCPDCAPYAGSRTSNLVPLSGRARDPDRAPWCASTIAFAIASPSPTPPLAAERDGSTR